MSWGGALRVLRHSRKVSGHEMARRLGVSRTRVYQIEDDTTNQTRETVQDYLKAIAGTLLERALVVDGLFDVALLSESSTHGASDYNPITVMRGTLRFAHGVELYDEDGDHAHDYKSVPDMVKTCDEAGWAVYLKLES